MSGVCSANGLKSCSSCGKVMSIDNFQKSGKNEEGLQKYRSKCKECSKIVRWEQSLLKVVKSRCRAKSKFNATDLDVEYIERLYKQQKGLCYWTKIPIDTTKKDRLRMPSIDRIDNNKGYIKGNIYLTTLFANTGRQNATPKEFKSFLNKYLGILKD